jgi:hypothetical protein
LRADDRQGGSKIATDANPSAIIAGVYVALLR